VSDIADSPEPTPNVLRNWEQQGVDEQYAESLLQQSGAVLDATAWSLVSANGASDERNVSDELPAEQWASLLKTQFPSHVLSVVETPAAVPPAVVPMGGARLAVRGATLAAIAFPPQTTDEMTRMSVMALVAAVGVGLAVLSKSKGENAFVASSFDGSVAGHLARQLGVQHWVA
jgi:hypothetical protein